MPSGTALLLPDCTAPMPMRMSSITWAFGTMSMSAQAKAKGGWTPWRHVKCMKVKIFKVRHGWPSKGGLVWSIEILSADVPMSRGVLLVVGKRCHSKKVSFVTFGKPNNYLELERGLLRRAETRNIHQLTSARTQSQRWSAALHQSTTSWNGWQACFTG